MNKLDAGFYQRSNVLMLAKELLGKVLVTQFKGVLTAGRIVETEAYNGIIDKASHAYNGKRTTRTEIMYMPGGHAYVYLCYGIHHLFNVVTNVKDVPHAVLIRALEPLEGIDIMLKRSGKTKADFSLTRGPGNLSRAMGILTAHSGYDLSGDEIYIADDGLKLKRGSIVSTPRIGVDYAGEDALLPYRFILKDSPYISQERNKFRI
jgi:DNA-3-methyladenine glycosylase